MTDFDEEFFKIAAGDFADRVEQIIEAMRVEHEKSIHAAREEDMEAFAATSGEAVRIFSAIPWATLPTVMMGAVAQINRERELSIFLFQALVEMVESSKEWAASAPDDTDSAWMMAFMDLLTTANARIAKAPFEVEDLRGL